MNMESDRLSDGGGSWRAGGDRLRVCLAGNDRRVMRYDVRLIRPRLVPNLVRMALIFIH